MRWLVARAALVLLLALAAPVAAEPVIVALGDSLTAGFGVAPDEAYPARLAERLRREGYDYRVVNAGVSGDTSAGGLRRLDWVLRAKPEIVIVALGANDGLRGQSVAAMRENLAAIVRRIRATGAQVLLAGMRMPPNYGEAFTRDFAAAYAEVARGADVRLVPFLLDGVAANPALNLPDGIHPNAAGHRVIADRLWPHLQALLRTPAAAKRTSGIRGHPTIVTQPALVYVTPAPVVMTPVYPVSAAPVVATPVGPASPPTVIHYPHGRQELRWTGRQYVWVWFPVAPPPPPPPPPPAAPQAPDTTVP